MSHHFNAQAFNTLKRFAGLELLVQATWSVENSPQFWQKHDDTRIPCIIFYPATIDHCGRWQIVRQYWSQNPNSQARDVKDLLQLYEALVEVNPKILSTIANPEFIINEI